MQKLIKSFLISTVVLVLLDSIYIYINKTAFENLVASVQRTVLQINLWGAIITYLLLVGGLFYLIIRRNRPVEEAFALGIVIYGVFEGTNYAMFKRWSPTLAIMDTIWGGILMAATTGITYTLSNL